MSEIDISATRLEMIEFCMGVDVAFTESGEGRGGLRVQGEGGSKTCPVDFGDCGTGRHFEYES